MHRKQRRSTMSLNDLKTRFEIVFSRMNCQMFSCGFSSGHFAGNAIRVMLGGTMSPPDRMPAGLIDEQRGVRRAPGARSGWRFRKPGAVFTASVSHRGHDEGCALAVLGADRAEDIGGDRCSADLWERLRARAALGPSAGDLVLPWPTRASSAKPGPLSPLERRRSRVRSSSRRSGRLF